MAIAVTMMPKSRPAMKKSVVDFVRRIAQMPTPIHRAKYSPMDSKAI
jgi:hypothetical protein